MKRLLLLICFLPSLITLHAQGIEGIWILEKGNNTRYRFPGTPGDTFHFSGGKDLSVSTAIMGYRMTGTDSVAISYCYEHDRIFYIEKCTDKELWLRLERQVSYDTNRKRVKKKRYKFRRKE